MFCVIYHFSFQMNFCFLSNKTTVVDCTSGRYGDIMEVQTTGASDKTAQQDRLGYKGTAEMVKTFFSDCLLFSLVL